MKKLDEFFRELRITMNIAMRVRNDGVYLLYTQPGTKPNETEKKEVRRVISGMNVMDVDETVLKLFLEEEFESPEERIITANVANQKMDAEVDITITRDELEAAAVFSPPGILGKELGEKAFRDKIKDAGIVFGLDDKIISAIARNVKYGERYIIAAGIAPVEGVHGKVDVKVNLSGKSNKPKELEDGRVDFKQVDFFVAASPREVLAVSVPPTEGTNGTNVFGKVVEAKPGRPAPKLPKGKNTEISEDGRSLIATIGGQISIINNLIHVLPVLEIQGDVGNETGNISFEGAVNVRGVVSTGFRIEATGDVEVRGMVEGAVIEAGGNISMLAGVQGVEKAVIRAGGDITTKFAQHATLYAKRNIISDAILHCTVDCEGSVLLDGRKRLLVGGKTRAAKAVSASIIGSSMATQTEVTVGNSPDILEKYNNAVQELMTMRKEYERVSQMVDQVLKAGNVQSLPVEKKKLLHSAMNLKKDLRTKITEMQAVADGLLADMSLDKGEIKVRDVVYAGVKVTIGDAVKYIRDDVHHCTLRVSEGKIVTAPF